MKLIRLPVLLSLGALFITTTLLSHLLNPRTAEAAVADISCHHGYTASLYAGSLTSPDGLAMSPDGLIYVAEEGSGEITRFDSGGSPTVVLDGLTNPEGIAFDTSGNLYVVEDKENGRLIRQDTNGITTTLASDLLAPEGVVVAADGTIYVTESGLQVLALEDPATYIDLDLIDGGNINVTNFDPADFQIITDTLVSRIKAFSPTAPFTPTTIITATPEYTPTINPNYTFGFPPTLNYIDIEVELDFLSYSGISIGNNGNLYVAAELSNLNTMTTTNVNMPISGVPIVGTVLVNDVTVETKSIRSVLQVNPTTGISMTHVNHLTATEGIRFTQSGQYPLYIVQEDASGLVENGTGRLDIALSDGTTSVLCDGFETIEDVLVGPDGVIYVSEDSSGSIIKIENTNCVPADPPTDLSLALTASLDLSWITTGTHDYMVWQSTSDPYIEPDPIGCQLSGSCTFVGSSMSLSQATATQQFLTVSSISTVPLQSNGCHTTAAATTTVGIFSFGLKPGD